MDFIFLPGLLRAEEQFKIDSKKRSFGEKNVLANDCRSVKSLQTDGRPR